MQITGNGNDANLLKSICEKLGKSHQVNLFLAGFSHLELLCTSATGGSAAAAGATREDALNTVSESTGKATSSGQADVVRHGLPANSGRNSESVGVRKGCDQDEARHRPASGAEVVRYKVESGPTCASNNSAVGGFETKSSSAKNQNQISSLGTSSDKDKKQQMHLRHQVSYFATYILS